MSILAARPARRKSRPLVSKQIDMTKGPIFKGLALFFLPILMGSLMQQLYVTVDAIVIGQFVGKMGLAAIDCVFNLCRLPVVFFVGLSAGAGIVVAQCFGSRSLDRLSRIIHTSLIFALVLGILLGLLGIVLRPFALSFLNVPEEIAPNTYIYLLIYFAGLPFVTLYNLGSGILRSVGDSRTPFWALGLASLVNVVLDIIFVAVLHGGVAGAALATLIAQASSAVYVLVVMSKKRSIKADELSLEELERCEYDPEKIESYLADKQALVDACRISYYKLKVHRHELRSMIVLGFPVAVQSSLYTLANMYVQSAVNATGTDNIAAWSLVGKLDVLIWLIIEALTIVVTTYCAQNFGAQQRDRMIKGVRYALISSCVMVAVLSFTLYILSEPLGFVFLGRADADVIKLSASFLAMIAPYYVMIVPSEIWSSEIRGMGHTIGPMILTLISVFVTRVLWVALVVPFWPYGMNINFGHFVNEVAYVVILVYPVSWTCVTLCIGAYYFYFKKKYLAPGVEFKAPIH